MTIRRAHAFTLAELIVILAITGLLAGVLIPSLARAKVRGRQIQCAQNLKGIAVAFRMFANQGDRFPFDYPLPLTNPQTGINIASNITTARAWMHFQAMPYEISNPKILMCPEDMARLKHAASDFLNGPDSLGATNRRDLALSYFVGLGASETQPQSILSGDRNLAADSTSAPYSSDKGAVIVPATSRWTSVKTNTLHGANGNFVVADGSVQQASGLQSQAVTNAYGTNMNLFLFPQ